MHILDFARLASRRANFHNGGFCSGYVGIDAISFVKVCARGVSLPGSFARRRGDCANRKQRRGSVPASPRGNFPFLRVQIPRVCSFVVSMTSNAFGVRDAVVDTWQYGVMSLSARLKNEVRFEAPPCWAVARHVTERVLLETTVVSFSELEFMLFGTIEWRGFLVYASRELSCFWVMFVRSEFMQRWREIPL